MTAGTNSSPMVLAVKRKTVINSALKYLRPQKIPNQIRHGTGYGADQQHTHAAQYGNASGKERQGGAHAEQGDRGQADGRQHGLVLHTKQKREQRDDAATDEREEGGHGGYPRGTQLVRGQP